MATWDQVNAYEQAMMQQGKSPYGNEAEIDQWVLTLPKGTDFTLLNPARWPLPSPDEDVSNTIFGGNYMGGQWLTKPTPTQTTIVNATSDIKLQGVKTMSNYDGYSQTSLSLNPFAGLLDNIGGNTLSWAALAYGAYEVLIKRRKSMLGIAALAYGAWTTGILGSLIPKDSSGKANYMSLLPALLGSPVLAAATGGLGAVLLQRVISPSRRRSYRPRTRYIRSYRTRRWRRY